MKKILSNKKIILIVICICIALISMIYILSNLNKLDKNIDYNEKLSITTNKGTVINTLYENFGAFSLKIPETFNLMSQEAIDVKYPSENQPSLVYTNDDGSININIKITETVLKNNNIEEEIKKTEKLFRQIDDNIDVNLSKRESYNLGELKFMSKAIDTNIYNHMLLFSINDKMTVISFNCTEKDIDEWKNVGDFIIKSIKFS